MPPITRRQSLAILAAASASAQQPAYPPQFEGATVETYKTIGDVRMNLWIFSPPGHTAAQSAPAIVFFFGGGWTNGSPRQFEQHCRHLASRGMVAITADYRVASRHHVKVIDCIRDAKSAIRYVRSNAKKLGIDRQRIAAGGGSAGGHLAAATGVIEGLDEQNENTKISSRPNALVMYNPALVLAPAPDTGFEKMPANLVERFGADSTAVSPFHHLKKGAPPAIIFHGKADTTVPYLSAEAFTRKSVALGNRCELDGYDGQVHGFFNYGRNNNEFYEKTLKRTDTFLASLGYLK